MVIDNDVLLIIFLAICAMMFFTSGGLSVLWAAFRGFFAHGDGTTEFAREVTQAWLCYRYAQDGQVCAPAKTHVYVTVLCNGGAMDISVDDALAYGILNEASQRVLYANVVDYQAFGENTWMTDVRMNLKTHLIEWGFYDAKRTPHGYGTRTEKDKDGKNKEIYDGLATEFAQRFNGCPHRWVKAR